VRWSSLLPAMQAFRDFTLAEGAAHLPRLPEAAIAPRPSF
jgi:hypothetical protein